jgi:hypothetical protein
MQEFKLGKKMEAEMQFKTKLKHQRMTDDEKISKMRRKFKEMDERYTGQKNDLSD